MKKELTSRLSSIADGCKKKLYRGVSHSIKYIKIIEQKGIDIRLMMGYNH